MIKNILEDELIEISQKLEKNTHQIPGGLDDKELNEIKSRIDNCLALVRQL